MDLFYECYVADFAGAKAADDAAELFILRPEALSPAAFGLESVRKAVAKYKESVSNSLK